MRTTVAAVRNKEMGPFRATRVFNAPENILKRCDMNVHRFHIYAIQTEIGRKPILPPAM
jgi:hypothetical protein